MIQDATLDDYKIAAAVRVFKENFSEQLVLSERRYAEKVLMHRLNQIPHLSRLKLCMRCAKLIVINIFWLHGPNFNPKLDHYNRTVNGWPMPVTTSSKAPIVPGKPGSSLILYARYYFNPAALVQCQRT